MTTPPTPHSSLLTPDSSFDPLLCRQSFPLWDPVAPPPPIWLDSAATAPRLRCALDAARDFDTAVFANPRRSVHRLGVAATQALETARASLADFLHAPDPDGIVFTSGATASANLLALALPPSDFAPDATVWIALSEHHSSGLPFARAARRHGAAVHLVPLTPSGDLDLDALSAALSSSPGRPTWIVAASCSNVIGRPQPIPALAALARRHGARLFVDAAQTAAHAPIDVAAWDCDFLAFSGHKIGAPAGTGLLWGRASEWPRLVPHVLGGEMVDDVPLSGPPVYASLPARYEPGTPNAAGALALAAAAQWHAALPPAARAHVHALADRLASRLAAVPGLRFLGAVSDGVPRTLLSFTVDGIHPHDIAQCLDAQNIAVRAGRLCAHPLLAAMDVPAAVRISLFPTNTVGDVDAAAAVVAEAVALFAP